MRKKNVLWMCLVTFLLLSVAIVHVGAQQTILSVDPKSSTAEVGDEFTVKIRVADVNDLTGFEFKLFWDRALLNVTDASYTVPDPSWKNPLWLPYSPAVPLNNEYNTTHGRFWLGCLNLPIIPISGDFTLATLTFKVMSQDSGTLDLCDTKLTDSKGEQIPHDTIDGDFTALPGGGGEQPAASFPVEKIAIVVVVAVFLVAALYYAKKKKMF